MIIDQIGREESCVFEGGKEMINENKKIVADYMGYLTHPMGSWYDAPVYFAAGTAGNINFDLNDAGLVVQEMQKRGEWEEFEKFGFVEFQLDKLGYITAPDYELLPAYIAWLFSSDNFFDAFAAWRKTK